MLILIVFISFIDLSLQTSYGYTATNGTIALKYIIKYRIDVYI